VYRGAGAGRKTGPVPGDPSHRSSDRNYRTGLLPSRLSLVTSVNGTASIYAVEDKNIDVEK
jgi:hypothetical protein